MLISKLTNKFESNNIIFPWSLYTETGRLEVTGVGCAGRILEVVHCAMQFNIVNRSMIRDLMQCHLLDCHSLNYARLI